MSDQRPMKSQLIALITLDNRDLTMYAPNNTALNIYMRIFHTGQPHGTTSWEQRLDGFLKELKRIITERIKEE